MKHYEYWSWEGYESRLPNGMIRTRYDRARLYLTPFVRTDVVLKLNITRAEQEMRAHEEYCKWIKSEYERLNLNEDNRHHR